MMLILAIRKWTRPPDIYVEVYTVLHIAQNETFIFLLSEFLVRVFCPCTKNQPSKMPFISLMHALSQIIEQYFTNNNNSLEDCLRDKQTEICQLSFTDRKSLELQIQTSWKQTCLSLNKTIKKGDWKKQVTLIRRQQKPAGAADTYVGTSSTTPLPAPSEPSPFSGTSAITSFPSALMTIFDSRISQISQIVIPEWDDSWLIDGIEVMAPFKLFQKECFKEIENACFEEHDFQKLLSLSHIMLIKPSGGTQFLNETHANQIYQRLMNDLLADLPPIPDNLMNSLFTSFLTFSQDNNRWAFIGRLASEAEKNSNNKYVSCLIEMLVSLVFEVNQHNVNKSEFHVQCGFIHPVVRSICKQSDDVVAHSSNKLAMDDQEASSSRVRPDYRVDMYGTTCSIVSTNMYGEVKPKNTKPIEVLNDFHKIAIFGKVGLKHSSTGAGMTFRSVDNHVFFYLNYRAANYGFVCLYLGDFEIPTTKGTLMSILGSLPLIYKLAYIYDCTCLKRAQAIPHQNNFSSHTTTLSCSLGESLISNKESKKRRSACL